MFILTKSIFASLCKNWKSVYSAGKNKKIILSFKKLACVLLEEKLGQKCLGIAHLCPGTASEEGKEGSHVSLSSCLSIPDVLLFQAWVTFLPHDCAHTPIRRG